MVELGQLEKHHAEFEQRHVRIFVVSDDDRPTAEKTQADFPHLRVVSDADHTLANAVEVIHAGAGRGGKDTNAPTTFLIDGAGKVRWVFRPNSFVRRLSPEEVLAEIDPILAR
jgi:peroxiredoxin